MQYRRVSIKKENEENKISKSEKFFLRNIKKRERKEIESKFITIWDLRLKL